jgi:branched-chain amino acid transport system ATP-binding protein
VDDSPPTAQHDLRFDRKESANEPGHDDRIGYREVQFSSALSCPQNYGRQKQIEFGPALMQRGRLLLLDDPMAGMSAAEKAEMTARIKRVRHDL